MNRTTTFNAPTVSPERKCPKTVLCQHIPEIWLKKKLKLLQNQQHTSYFPVRTQKGDFCVWETEFTSRQTWDVSVVFDICPPLDLSPTEPDDLALVDLLNHSIYMMEKCCQGFIADLSWNWSSLGQISLLVQLTCGSLWGLLLEPMWRWG